MRWKEFVKNRVQAIKQITPDATWKFVSGKHNPADCASRGLSSSQLIAHPLWWSGPAWLSHRPHLWPLFIIPEGPPTDDEIRPSAIHVSSSPQLPFGILFSEDTTLTKLLRVTATIQRAAARFKRVPESSLTASPLNPTDLQLALTFWIKATQRIYLSTEIRLLSQGKDLTKSRPLTRLTARIDHAELLRVGGRLRNSQLDEDAKHPPILPKDSIISRLIIANAHARTLHGGTQLTLNYIRKNCWILGGRAPIKSYIHRCLTCTRIRGVRGRGTRTYKAWILLFVCLSTSAIHLEAVTDYSADGFLKALKRFTARRGICKTLTSDCATNFQGVDVALKRLLSGSLTESLRLQQLIANDGTQWKFNPPGAPHMGGKWKAAVKSVKYHLQRTITSDTLLTYEGGINLDGINFSVLIG